MARQTTVPTEQTYSIKRFYAPHRQEPDEIIKTGLTLEEAQEHCRQKDTHENGEWFDGYVKE